MVRVVHELVRRLAVRRCRVECPVAEHRVGVAAAVQVVRSVLRPRYGPVGRCPPLVRAHDEDVDGRIIGDTVVDSLEPVVEPAQVLVQQVELDRVSIVDITGNCLGPSGAEAVYPRADDHLLIALAGLHSALPDAHEVVERALEKHVEPSAHAVGRHVDVVVSLLDRSHALPVVVVVGMGDPVLPVPVDPSGCLVHRVQRQVPEEIGHVVVFREPHVLDLVGARVHLDRDPPQVERELERAAGVRPVMVEVRVPDPGHHRLEVLAAARSGLPLRHGKVGAARGSHVAVAPRL